MTYKDQLLEDYFTGTPFRMCDAIEDTIMMGKAGMDRDQWEAFKELDREFPGARDLRDGAI